jgi:Xaa-Pro aminopeptidase
VSDAGFVERLRGELVALGAEALVVLAHEPGDPDLAPFTGRARLGEAFVVLPADGAPRLGYWTPMERDEAAATGLERLDPEILDLPRLARELPQPDAYLAATLAAALTRCGVAPGRLALAGSWPAGVLIAAGERLGTAGWSFVPASEALRRARKSKSAAERTEIRRVAAVTCEAFRALAARLAAAVVRDGELDSEGERLSVGRIKAEIAVCFAAAGLAQPREAIVAPAEEGGVPHTTGTPERVLRAGESLIVDLFPKGLLYADCTRTFCVGEPPEPLARAHGDALEALALAREQARPGARGWDLQRAVCALLAERGWPTPVDSPGTLRGYVHNLGHGVGYELHELPSFREGAASGSDGLLATGDVLALEPGIYEPGAGGFGVRLEDLVVLEETGAENLTPLPYALDPRAWRG